MFLFWAAPVSRVSTYVILTARVLAVWAWGMTTALGPLLGNVLDCLASLRSTAYIQASQTSQPAWPGSPGYTTMV